MKRRIEQVHGEGAVPKFQTHAAILSAVGSGGKGFIYIQDGLRTLRALRANADYELHSAPLIWNAVHTQVRFSRNLIRTHIKSLPDAEFRRLDIRRT